MRGNYKICTRCIMDTTDPEIQFDDNGICNHCRRYEESAKKRLHYDKRGREKLNNLVIKIKQEGKNKRYDCMTGLSGGVDSTTATYYAVKKFGLRPLGIHVDNGWDPEVTTKNIKNIVKNLGIDLYIYSLDWEEFRDLQLSFLKASVINWEMPTDHVTAAAIFQVAREKGLRYIISGRNIVTEEILPQSWSYNARDLRNLREIHKRFGSIPLKNTPTLSILGWIYYTFVKKIRIVPILNYVPYIREEAKALIKKELGWKDYGEKHHESIFTRFYQGYVLPKRFNIDKRKAHLSTLINSGQITREEALEGTKKLLYSREQIEEDKDYVLKKLGLTEEEFEKIMSKPIKKHTDYPNNQFLFSKLMTFAKLAKKITT